MSVPPPPWPYSDWDQRPPERAPWQMGSSLYEAYGSFLGRIRAGTVDEIDDGEHWEYGGGLVDKEPTSGAYDAGLGYWTDTEAEAHRLREIAKEDRAAKVDAAAARHIKRLKAAKAAVKERIHNGKRERKRVMQVVLREIRQLGRPFTARDLHQRCPELKQVGMVLVRISNAGHIRKTGEMRLLKAGLRPQPVWELAV